MVPPKDADLVRTERTVRSVRSVRAVCGNKQKFKDTNKLNFTFKLREIAT